MLHHEIDAGWGLPGRIQKDAIVKATTRQLEEKREPWKKDERGFEVLEPNGRLMKEACLKGKPPGQGVLQFLKHYYDLCAGISQLIHSQIAALGLAYCYKIHLATGS